MKKFDFLVVVIIVLALYGLYSTRGPTSSGVTSPHVSNAANETRAQSDTERSAATTPATPVLTNPSRDVASAVRNKFTLEREAAERLQGESTRSWDIRRDEMTDRIRTIMDRYKWDLNLVPLPKLNLAIKELAERAGLTKPIHYYRHKLREAVVYEEPMYKLLSMHSGRRSFITNAFTRGFSVPEILEMIGSADAKVLSGYMAITGSHLVNKTKELSK